MGRILGKEDTDRSLSVKRIISHFNLLFFKGMGQMWKGLGYIYLKTLYYQQEESPQRKNNPYSQYWVTSMNSVLLQ